MSSKKKPNSGDGPRQPKCTRCRHHGQVVPQKGHAKRCPYLQCSCWKCALIAERTRINALQRKLRRDTEEPPPAERGPAGQGHQGGTVTSPDRGARQPVPGGPVYPRPIRVSAPWVPGPNDRPAAVGARPVSASLSLGSGDQAAAPGSRPSNPPPHDSLFWGEYGLPLSFVGQMPASHSNFLVNMPWAAMPPGLYEGNLSPLMLPHFPPGLQYPPPPEAGPPVDSRPVFVTFRPPAVPPESHRQEALSSPPPQFTEEDTEEEKIDIF